MEFWGLFELHPLIPIDSFWEYWGNKIILVYFVVS
jgi:hypothetical protein